MSTPFSFEVITPAGLAFQAEVYEVVLPTVEGEIGILANHVSLTALVTPGVIQIRRQSEDWPENKEQLATAGGFVEVNSKRVRLLADTAERSQDLEAEKVRQALAQAEKMRDEAGDEVSLEKALQEVQQQRARLKVAELKKRRHRSA